MSRIEEAIRYYAKNPVDFVEDIIRAKPDSNQKAILRQKILSMHLYVSEKWLEYRIKYSKRMRCISEMQ